MKWGNETVITVLAKWLIKEEGKDKTQIRQAYGTLCGVVGIILNILLFAGKFLAGTVSHSIAITADAFNNLSDAGSSVITLLGFHLAGAKPDPGHPFGHGRIEYLSGLVVSCAIIIMAFELVKDSIGKIMHPQPTECNLLIVVILLISILVKLYMAYYNRAIGKRIDSAAMRATGTDSLSDTLATTVVLIATLVAYFTKIQIDGYCGILVALFIFYAGISAAQETLNPLLGQPPDPELVEKIEHIVLSHNDVVMGIHDMVVHDYGPGRQMISLHAEVDASSNILEIHDKIDLIEAELREKLGCEAVIHMDPIVTNDTHVLELKHTVKGLVQQIDSQISIHDFRVVPGNTHTNLIFDVLVPYGYKMTDEEITGRIERDVKEKLGDEYFTVIKIDRAYVK